MPLSAYLKVPCKDWTSSFDLISFTTKPLTVDNDDDDDDDFDKDDDDDGFDALMTGVTLDIRMPASGPLGQCRGCPEKADSGRGSFSKEW